MAVARLAAAALRARAQRARRRSCCRSSRPSGWPSCIDNLLFEQFGADTRSLAPYHRHALPRTAGELPGGIYVGKLPVLTFVDRGRGAGRAAAVAELHAARPGDPRHRRRSRHRRPRRHRCRHGQRRWRRPSPWSRSGVAGAFLAMRATFDAYAGAPQLLFAFEAVVIGGVGSLWGTLIGGIVLGVAQTLGAQVASAGLPDRRPCRLPRRAVRAPLLAGLACAARVAHRSSRRPA